MKNDNGKIQELLSMISQGSFFDNLVKLFFIPLQTLTARGYKKIKKERKIIISTNLRYAGNPRAVFERMLERNLKKYEPYWMTGSVVEFLKLRKKGLPVLYKHGILAIDKYINAELWVLAHRGAMNLPVFLQGKYKTIRKIQLEHGVGPKATRGTDREYDIYAATCVSSESIKERHVVLWGAPEDKLYATGFARLDTLLKYLKKERRDILEELHLPTDYNKVVLHAPTYDLGLWPWGDPYEGLEHMAKFLKEHNTLFLVRPHPYTQYDRKKLKKIAGRVKNLKIVPMEQYPEVQSILAVSDVLITDWSSTYTDFLVTRRPIIFLDVNRKYFLEERVENAKPEVPPELRPGVKVHTEEELRNELVRALCENYIPNREFYERCLQFIHGHPDGHYSDRVIEVIEQVLK